MRIPRIYFAGELKINQVVTLTASASAHILRVLRLKEGDQLKLFDGLGHEFSAEIIGQEQKIANVKIDAKIENQSESPLRIHLGQGLSRGEKMDFTLQKAVEMGVHEITPLLTDYCEVKLTAERLEKRLAHWQAVIISACEQCGRSYVPIIHAPKLFTTWIKECQQALRILLHPGMNQRLSQLTLPADKNIIVAAGPEGGFSTQEATFAEQNKFHCVALGPRILRTETAALAALTALQTLWGDIN